MGDRVDVYGRDGLCGAQAQTFLGMRIGSGRRAVLAHAPRDSDVGNRGVHLEMTAILWMSNGQALIELSGKYYWYFSVKRKDWERVKAYCRKKDKRIHTFLRKFSRPEMMEDE